MRFASVKDKCFSLLGITRAFHTTNFCQTGKPLMGSFPICFHNLRQQHRHSLAVGNAVKSAQGMPDGMYIANAAPGEGTPGVESTQLHILSCFQITAIFIGTQQTFMD